MGSFLTKFRYLSSSFPSRIVLLGLDAAGKTTILYKLKLGEIVTTIPTIGFNVETVSYKNIDFTTWDVGGRGGLRPLHRFYYQGVNAFIFVLDSNDRERFDDAKEQLERALTDIKEHSGSVLPVPVLIFANKQDLPNALCLSEINSRLQDTLKDHLYFVQGSCAPSGDGLYEGLDWLTETLNAVRKAGPQAEARKKEEGKVKEGEGEVGLSSSFTKAVQTMFSKWSTKTEEVKRKEETPAQVEEEKITLEASQLGLPETSATTTPLVEAA